MEKRAAFKDSAERLQYNVSQLTDLADRAIIRTLPDIEYVYYY